MSKHAGIYVAFEARPDRISKGARAALCNRCGKLVAHHPLDSVGHELVCLNCANDIPQIREHIDRLAKERGE